MSPKQEQTFAHLFHSLALNAVTRYIQTMNLTWDTYNHSHKVATLQSMAQLIENAIVQLEENLEHAQSTNNGNN